MPVVEVKLWSGRTPEQKAEIIKDITAVFEKQGVPKEATTVIIHDIEKTNWGMKGEPANRQR
jgi:4-oxalocrotonate tautomerase family enzyme